MGNICSSSGIETRARPPANESVALTSIGGLFKGNLFGVRNAPRLTDLPPEMLCEIADNLDAKSYTDFRASCRHVRSALLSPRQINERVKQAPKAPVNFYRLSAQGKLASLIKRCNSNIRFSLKHSLHKWLPMSENVPGPLGFAFLFGNYSFAANRRDQDTIETVLNQLDHDLTEDENGSPWLYIFRDGYDFGLNYAIHIVAIESPDINPRVLATLMAAANRIFQAGTGTEKLITLAFVSHFLKALTEQPDTARLYYTRLHQMFSDYPELMYCTREMGKWRTRQNPDCFYMRVVSEDGHYNV